jgi:hypothetical protein
VAAVPIASQTKLKKSWYSGGQNFRLLCSICVYFPFGVLLQVVILAAVVWGGLGSVSNVILLSSCEPMNKNIYLCDGIPLILFCKHHKRDATLLDHEQSY